MKGGQYMALDKGDTAIVRQIAYEVSKEIKKELLTGFAEQIAFHAATCSGKKLWILYGGIAIGSGIGGVAGGMGLLKLMGIL